MVDETEQTEKPSILFRPIISNRITEVFVIVSLIAVAISILFMPRSCGHDYEQAAKEARDMSHLKMAVTVIWTYAAENEARPPAHIQLAKEFGLEAEMLVSPHDQDNTLVYEDDPEPGWYQYGSYWFLSAEHANLEAIEKAPEFILVYRTPRADSEFYLVGHLDGSVSSISSEDFAQRMYRQGELINQLEN